MHAAEEKDNDIGLLANGASGPWQIEIDEQLRGDNRWFIQIDGPTVCLYFEIPSLEIVRELAQFLDTNLSQQHTALMLGKANDITVTIVRDDEYQDRYFLNVGSAGNLVVRLTIESGNVKNIAEALEQVLANLRGED